MQREEQRENPAARAVVPVPICLPRAMVRELDDQVSREQLFSRSAVVRRACRDYLDRHREEAHR